MFVAMMSYAQGRLLPYYLAVWSLLLDVMHPSQEYVSDREY